MRGNPVRFTDPSGHAAECGGGTDECNSHQYTNPSGNYASPAQVDAAVETAGTVLEIGAIAATAVVAGEYFGAEETLSTAWNWGRNLLAPACADGDCTNEVEEGFDAINTGTNVVYRSAQNGVTKYVGITNNFARRASEHLRTRGWVIEPIQNLESLSRFDARAVEQVLIEHYGLENLYNRINSVATNNPIYQESIRRGTDLLNQIGFLD